MLLQRLFCWHDLEMCATNSGCGFSDTGPIAISFYRCKKCGRRTASAGKYGCGHRLANAYIDRWVKAGWLPRTENTQIYIDPDRPARVAKLKLVKK